MEAAPLWVSPTQYSIDGICMTFLLCNVTFRGSNCEDGDIVYPKPSVNACLGQGVGSNSKGRTVLLGRILSQMVAVLAVPLTCNSLASAWD